MYKTFVILSGLIVACITQPAHSEPVNLNTLKHTLIQYHDSGDYMNEVHDIAIKAREKLALEITKNSTLKNPKKLAIVLDIDETVLSNYDDMKKRDFGGTLADIHHDVSLADGKPIKPMRTFYQFAKQNHLAIFFVTGRNQNERAVTIKNLKQARFSGWERLYLKPNHYHQLSAIPYKLASRKDIEKHGFTIVETIGDQDSDYQGGDNGTPFKLPNPYYHLP
jgi:predicted secreted acid phosphatase